MRFRPTVIAGLCRVACGLMAGGLLASCDHALLIPARFPDLLVEPLPLDAGIFFPADFAAYTHVEKVGGTEWKINIGAASVALFDRAAGRIFRRASRLPAAPVPGVANGLDAVIVPSVSGFEFSLPSQSATDQYSVWIRYTLDVYGPAGELISSLPVTAYGQSDARRFSAAAAMEQATIVAMRDAAASLATTFTDQGKLRRKLLGELPAGAASNDDAP